MQVPWIGRIWHARKFYLKAREYVLNLSLNIWSSYDQDQKILWYSHIEPGWVQSVGQISKIRTAFPCSLARVPSYSVCILATTRVRYIRASSQESSDLFWESANRWPGVRNSGLQWWRLPSYLSAVQCTLQMQDPNFPPSLTCSNLRRNPTC